ncbi:cytochrome c oxidase subunit 2 [Variovorax sp. GrIS 2.14]|uniref:cupredoxin domain-containing protein n=1 Tax=Variovorax sp. GrIS 2.14 TaxID=3071709 RepID=UPI0038F811CA
MNIDTKRRTLVNAAGALALSSVAVLALSKPKERIIKIIAKKFEYVPSEIRVKQGETVMLQFTAPEVPMGFSLPDFAVRADIMPGKVTTLRLTPDKTGSFAFLCDVFCGTGHEDMNGMLIVS